MNRYAWRGRTIKYQSLENGRAAVALIQPAGSSQLVWRYRYGSREYDIPYHEAHSLQEALAIHIGYDRRPTFPTL